MEKKDRIDKGQAPASIHTRRPKIPIAISREVLIESGHRCAVCGTSCPLERAHIIPWRESREHKREDLICLCANCHQRADQEEWGVKILYEYKRRPWILRQGTDFVAPQPTKRVYVTLAMEFQSYDAKTQRLFVHAIAGFLGIPPEDVKVCSVEEGSVRLVVELPAPAADRLIEAGMISLQDYLDTLGEMRIRADPEASETTFVETLGSVEQLADLKAKAWGQYANALRISGRLAEAEAAFAKAQQFREKGTGDPPLRASTLTVETSLRVSQRRFAEAIMLADEALQIYRELGQSSEVASTMVQRAIADLYAGDAVAAARTLDQVIPLIDSERDPRLLLSARHNLIRCHIELGQSEQALALYYETRDLYRQVDDPLILHRAQWQEGLLLRDLGRLRAAEAAFLRARAGFLERGLPYEAAMVSLDLAALYLKLNMWQSLQETVAETVPIFKALGLGHEALAMLLQLGQASHQGHQAVMLIHELTSRIEKLKSSNS